MLNPTESDRQRGVWEYNSQADGDRWHYVILEGVTYALNSCYLDWDAEMEEWSQTEMGQWPFGNQLTEEEVFANEVEDVLVRLDLYLEAELEWMNNIEDEQSDDDSDDVDVISEDEGYETTPEVDFVVFDYWALGLNSHLWRIDLYKEGKDGLWTL